MISIIQRMRFVIGGSWGLRRCQLGFRLALRGGGGFSDDCGDGFGGVQDEARSLRFVSARVEDWWRRGEFGRASVKTPLRKG